MIGLMTLQGLKAAEITQIKIKDIDLQKGEIQIKSSIKSNSRTLKLQANQILLLHEFIQEKNADCGQKTADYLIQITAEDITKFCKRNLKITPTKIRQSVIKNLIKKGNDIRIVQHFAGHKDADTTEKYKEKNLHTLQENIGKYHTFR
jgi:integrase/recombinase XerD